MMSIQEEHKSHEQDTPESEPDRLLLGVHYYPPASLVLHCRYRMKTKPVWQCLHVRCEAGAQPSGMISFMKVLNTPPPVEEGSLDLDT